MTSILGIIRGSHHLTTVSTMIVRVSKPKGLFDGLSLELTLYLQETTQYTIANKESRRKRNNHV